MKEDSPRYTLRDLPADCRPRERMAARGPAALSNGELIAILLRTGYRQKTALELADQILSQPEGLRYLLKASLEELAGYKGIGMAKAAILKAACEIGKRLSTISPEMRPTVNSPRDAAYLLMEELRYLDRETFRIICLNTKNQVLSIEMISQGSLNASLVHPREVFKSAITRSSAAIVLAHNHPSGDPAPSPEDWEVTRRLAEVGRLMGIEVLDHIIIGNDRFISLKEQGTF